MTTPSIPAFSELRKLKAQAIIDEHVDAEALAELQEEAEAAVSEFEETIADINERLQELSEGDFELPEAVIPEPELPKIPRVASIISTAWSWVEQTRAWSAAKNTRPENDRPHFISTKIIKAQGIFA